MRTINSFRHGIPGHWWGVPFSDRREAKGHVIVLGHRGSVFVAALLNDASARSHYCNMSTEPPSPAQVNGLHLGFEKTVSRLHPPWRNGIVSLAETETHLLYGLYGVIAVLGEQIYLWLVSVVLKYTQGMNTGN